MGETLRYRAVLFDLDGTLVDSYAALAEAVNHARGANGLGPISALRIREIVGDGVERLLQRAFGWTEIPRDVVEAFERRYDEICCERSRILDEVEDTLRELDDLGVRMAVCTNKPTSFSAKILDYLNLSRYFKAVVGPDRAGARKPDPRHVHFTRERTECEGRHTLFVGDMPVDIEAARNSGLKVAVVATGSSSREQLIAARPDMILDRFSELVPLVQRTAIRRIG
jgi:phosphoglycolate phosphatase